MPIRLFDLYQQEASSKLFSLWHFLSLHQQPLHRFELCEHWYDQASC